MKLSALILALLAGGATTPLVARTPFRDACTNATSLLQVPDVTIDRIDAVAPNSRWFDRIGKEQPAVGAAFCRVRGRIEREIGFELWLPATGRWNGKLLAAGVGGEAGTFNYADLARGVRRGYAAASTDTGHQLEDRDWALNRPDRRANFAARANHLLAVRSKAMLARYYGRPARWSYFIGCSGGGREGLKEMQAYPADFDGIVAGGAGPDQLAVSMRLLWSQYVVSPSISQLVDDRVWKRVSDAGIRACDDLDGIRDDVIADPLACRFDPASLRCPEGGQDCLTPAQVTAVKTIFAPLVDENGRAVDKGVLPGVRVTFEPRSAFAYTLFGRVVHNDPRWDPRTLNIARDMAAARAAWPDLPNDNADVTPFRKRGGKMIYYHGWMDPFILAQLPIAYHAEVDKRVGATDDFFRLFMVPGLGHCRGGPGPDQFGGAGADAPIVDADHDMLSALEAWVERGAPPNRIIASRVEDGAVTRSRPLCPYPQQAVYRRRGSPDQAANFHCQKPEPTP